MGQQWIERGRRLIAELEGRDDATARSLATNLMTCGVDWNGRYTCRCPACGPCRSRYIRAQQRNVLAGLNGLGNSDIAFATVVAGGSPDLDRVGEIIAETAKGTRNRIDAERRETPNQWGGVALCGWIEIDAVSADQMPLLGSDRRALLPEIATIATGHMQPTWVVSYHALVTLGGTSRDEVNDAFSRQWPIRSQVDVRDLNASRAVEDNVAGIVSYANKHASTTTLGIMREPWPISWQADLYSWFATKRSAFEFCRFKIGPSMVRNSGMDISDNGFVDCEPMPFIHSFSMYPMYNITGRQTD